MWIITPFTPKFLKPTSQTLGHVLKFFFSISLHNNPSNYQLDLNHRAEGVIRSKPIKFDILLFCPFPLEECGRTVNTPLSFLIWCYFPQFLGHVTFLTALRNSSIFILCYASHVVCSSRDSPLETVCYLQTISETPVVINTCN